MCVLKRYFSRPYSDCEVSCDGLPALDISSVVPLRKQQGLVLAGYRFCYWSLRFWKLCISSAGTVVYAYVKYVVGRGGDRHG